MARKFFATEVRPDKAEVWVPTYDEIFTMENDRELIDCPITDVSVGDIILDYRFMSITSLTPVTKADGVTPVGFTVYAISTNGCVHQAWFYPEETVSLVNTKGAYLHTLAPVAQMVERGVLTS